LANKSAAAAPLRAAIFASGNGTNAENILKHCEKLQGIEIAVIVTDQPYAGVIQRAKAFNVPCEIVARQRNTSKTEHEQAILAVTEKYKTDWIFLAGYMRILTPEFLRHFHDDRLGINRIVNIHPSLLPAFPGKDSYLEAFNAGVKISGVTLHFVDDDVDHGPIILQQAFERDDLDDFDTFRARGMQVEYEIYAQFLQHLAAGTWTVEDIQGTDQRIVLLTDKKRK